MACHRRTGKHTPRMDVIFISMDRFDRIYRLYTLFTSSREPRSAQSLQADLECSRATLMRAIAELRSLFDAPLIWDTEARGYRLDGAAPRTQLPGLWFSADELQALLLVQSLLSGLDEGVMPEQFHTLRGRIMALLARGGVSPQRASQVVRVLTVAGRPTDPAIFRSVVSATLAGRQLRFRYQARSTGEHSERQVSPQRLFRYRDNWYLGGWCHTRQGLRAFALDAISEASHGADPAHVLPDEEVDRHFNASYGIFGGSAHERAVLRFAASRARWVASERWHPDQCGHWLTDGRYELTVPYGDATELILDILRYGPDVEVISPPALRAELADRLRRAAALYDNPSTSR